MYEPTPEEAKAIKALHHAAKLFPKSLFLFSASGTLCIMRKVNGKKMETEWGGFDQDYVVDTVAIENEGGDWD